MTETELMQIEARLPKGASRAGTDLDASQLAAEVRNAWSESVELRHGLTETRNSGARTSEERDAAGALAERYKLERDALVTRCAALRRTLSELLSGLQETGPEMERALSSVVTRARTLLDTAS